MLTLGICCTKDTMDWVVVAGATRTTGTLVAAKKVTAPAGDRGQQLVWVRAEILELLGQHQITAVGLKVAEPGGRVVSVGRAEVEGVVQEALASREVSTTRLRAVNVRALFSARNTNELQVALEALDLLTARPVTRRACMEAALAVMAV